MEKVKELLQSRKFWALVIGLLAICAGYGTGKLDAWQAIQAAVAALAVYSTGIAIVDASAKIAASKAGEPCPPETPAVAAPGGIGGEDLTGSTPLQGASSLQGASRSNLSGPEPLQGAMRGKELLRHG